MATHGHHDERSLEELRQIVFKGAGFERPPSEKEVQELVDDLLKAPDRFPALGHEKTVRFEARLRGLREAGADRERAIETSVVQFWKRHADEEPLSSLAGQESGERVQTAILATAQAIENSHHPKAGPVFVVEGNAVTGAWADDPDGQVVDLAALSAFAANAFGGFSDTDADALGRLIATDLVRGELRVPTLQHEAGPGKFTLRLVPRGIRVPVPAPAPERIVVGEVRQPSHAIYTGPGSVWVGIVVQPGAIVEEMVVHFTGGQISPLQQPKQFPGGAKPANR